MECRANLSNAWRNSQDDSQLRNIYWSSFVTRLSTRNTNISFKTRKTFFAFIAMPCATFTAFLCCCESGCRSLGMLSKDNIYGFCFLFVSERQKSNSCDVKASRNKSTKVGRGKSMEMITSTPHHHRRRLEELAVCSSFRWSSIKTSGTSLWKLSCLPQSNKLLKVVVWDFGVVQLRVIDETWLRLVWASYQDKLGNLITWYDSWGTESLWRAAELKHLSSTASRFHAESLVNNLFGY